MFRLQFGQIGDARFHARRHCNPKRTRKINSVDGGSFNFMKRKTITRKLKV